MDTTWNDWTPWIGFDLDGTLALQGHGSWKYTIGRPILPMVEIAKEYLTAGYEVRIFTARVCEDPCDVQRRNIEKWCLEVIGQVLPVTNAKDYGLLRFYDDRAVAVQFNTGRVYHWMEGEDAKI